MLAYVDPGTLLLLESPVQLQHPHLRTSEGHWDLDAVDRWIDELLGNHEPVNTLILFSLENVEDRILVSYLSLCLLSPAPKLKSLWTPVHAGSGMTVYATKNLSVLVPRNTGNGKLHSSCDNTYIVHTMCRCHAQIAYWSVFYDSMTANTQARIIFP